MAEERSWHVEAVGVSRQGRRSGNEDVIAYRVFEEDAALAGFAVVCDGMGGHNAGEVASAMATESLKKFLESLGASRVPVDGLSPDEVRARVEEWVDEINQSIRKQGDANFEQRGMGTTMALAAILGPRRLLVANVGDSRIFLVRGGTVTQISVDHTALAEQRRILNVDSVAPQSGHGNPFAHALTRSLGQESRVLPDVRSDIELQEGDTVILTSDGVTDVLESERFLTALELSHSPAEAAERIYSLSFEAGSKDNISVVLLCAGRPKRLGCSIQQASESQADSTRPLFTPPPGARTAPEAPRRPAPPGPASHPRGAPSRAAKSSFLLLAVASGLAFCLLAVLALFFLKRKPAPAPSSGPLFLPSPVATAKPLLLPTRIVLPSPTARVLEGVEDLPSIPTEPPVHVPTVGPLVLRPTLPFVPRPPTPQPDLPRRGERPVIASLTASPVPAAIPVAATPVPAAQRPDSMEEVAAVNPRDAVLETARLVVDLNRKQYLFILEFDQRVSRPDRDFVVEDLSVLTQGKKSLLPQAAGRSSPAKLRFDSAIGKSLVFRLRFWEEFKGDLQNGDSVRIRWGGASNPFGRTEITAPVEVQR